MPKPKAAKPKAAKPKVSEADKNFDAELRDLVDNAKLQNLTLAYHPAGHYDVLGYALARVNWNARRTRRHVEMVLADQLRETICGQALYSSPAAATKAARKMISDTLHVLDSGDRVYIVEITATPDRVVRVPWTAADKRSAARQGIDLSTL